MQELEKILEEIDQEVKEYMEIDFGDEYNAGIKDMAKMAEKIIRKHMNDGWIPVEERLPEDGTYLCTLAGELCGIEEPFTGMCGIENGIWDEPDCVIAWRPLPVLFRSRTDRKGARENERD